MCTVNIKLDDATLRRIDPNLTNIESISRWLQRHVDIMIDEMAADELETMDIEDARIMVHDTIRDEYARL
jgi:hypothetical protein